MAESVVLKDVQSPERLLDEVSLFLHLVAADLPSGKQQMLERLRQSDEALIGRKVLVVDDDVRNIFALTSLLEQHGIQVVNAENGAEAISLLDTDDDIDAVLMDIMMPEMDGYETMRRIRLNSKHRLLPILALTAKAMKGDREKCLEAGASDYIAKPVDTDELLALLRIWLFGKQRGTRPNHEQRVGS
jgi:CheY-like chemotaxis protein